MAILGFIVGLALIFVVIHLFYWGTTLVAKATFTQAFCCLVIIFLTYITAENPTITDVIATSFFWSVIFIYFSNREAFQSDKKFHYERRLKQVRRKRLQKEQKTLNTNPNVPQTKLSGTKNIESVHLVPFSKPQNTNMTRNIPLHYDSFCPTLFDKGIDGYKIKEIIRSDALGSVYRGITSNGESVILNVVQKVKVSQLSKHTKYQDLLQDLQKLQNLNLILTTEVINDYLILIEKDSLTKNLQKTVQSQQCLDQNISIKLIKKLMHTINTLYQQGIHYKHFFPSTIEITSNTVNISPLCLSTLVDLVRDLTRNHAFESSSILSEMTIYCPPDISNKGHWDVQSDIFVLGSILFFMLSGNPPFGKTPIDKVILNILSSDYSPFEQKILEIEPNLEIAMRKMLAKKKEHRFKNIPEAYKALSKLN